MVENSTTPDVTLRSLIIGLAFDRDHHDELQQVDDSLEFQSEDRAVRAAKEMAAIHAGVIARSRETKPDIGECNEPEVLFQHGDMPDME